MAEALRLQQCRFSTTRPQPSSLVRAGLAHEVLGEDMGLKGVHVSAGLVAYHRAFACYVARLHGSLVEVNRLRTLARVGAR